MAVTLERPTILGKAEFDHGVLTATQAERSRMDQLSGQMTALGYPMDQLPTDGSSSSREILHDAATVLHMQWQVGRITRNGTLERASARLFNRTTAAARENQPTPTHVDDLKESLEVERLRQGGIVTDFVPLARIMQVLAEARTHDHAWSSVVLPTMTDKRRGQWQGYGRLTISPIDTGDEKYPAFFTQPYFGVTDPHDHGQNTAIAVAGGKTGNKHTNTTWVPNSREDAFDLRYTDRADYEAGDAVIVPRGSIHRISATRKERPTVYSIDQLAQMSLSDRKDAIADRRFGEEAVFHLYYPTLADRKLFEGNPFVTDALTDFQDYDMVVWDTRSRVIWTGGGGAWALRTATMGMTGEHCGKCFIEDDPRRENLDPRQVWDILKPQEARKPQLIKG